MQLTKHCCMTIVTVFLLAISGQAKAQTIVTIDHRTNVQNPEGLIQVAQGQQLTIKVLNTFPECFDYNFEPVLAPTTQAQRSARVKAAQPLKAEDVTFNINHDRQFGSYKITITAKDLSKDPSLKDQCDALPQKAQTYVVTITTYGWSVGFAGAFTADRLTDPVFSLRPGKQVTGEGANQMTTDGFFVEKNKSAEDSARLGAAAMVHLFHSDPERFSWKRFSVNWAPLSFGLGVDNGSQAHYFLGTSVKFGDQAFLTAGYVFGPRKRLPDGVHDFTTDQNALSSLPTKNSSAFFVGISYTFISVTRDTFQNAFKQNAPAPEKKPES